MHTRLERDYRFEAAHFLPNVPPGHKCARMHGHSYRIVIGVEGQVDPELGWLVDFAAIDGVATPVIAALDHQTLNEIEGLQNPTSENLAAWIWNQLSPGLPTLVDVAVAETQSSRCIYSGRS